MFHVYFYGENNSHCSSCWEPRDESCYFIFSELDLEKVKKIFLEEYIYNKWLSLEKIVYKDFLEILKNYSIENDKKYLYFSEQGISFLPEFESNMISSEHNLERDLSLPNLVGKEIDEIYARFEQNKIKRLEREEKKKKEKEELERINKEKEKEEKELELYNELKSKFEKKTVVL